MRGPRVIVCAVAVALSGAGCATLDPPAREDIRKEARLAIAQDQTWKAGANVSSDAAKDNWLATFNDPTLDQLIREALANNPDLRVAGARVAQVGQQLVIARAALKPWLGVVGTGGAKAGGGSDPTSALQGIMAAASWELDLWGRVRYQRNAAEQAYVSSQADYEFARQSIAAATAKAWFTATQLSLQANIAAEAVESSRQLLSFTEDRERVGAVAPSDVAVARANLRMVEDTLQQALFARGQALRALEVLVGRYPASEAAVRAEMLAMPAPPPVGVPLQMLERRPDVIAAERRVAAAFHRVGEARAARLPRITLNLSFGAFDSEILQLREDYENPSTGAGARLVAPIYQGGALNAQVEIRTLEQREAVADYARTALLALSDVENALAAEESLAARVSLLSAALDEQTNALNYTQTRLDVGRADKRALEQQRMNVQAARSALIDVQTERLTQRVNLHLALGGSFEAPQQNVSTQP